MTTRRTPAFVGLDIETTGLDPTKGVILELGMITFDHSLQPIAARSWLTNELADHEAWMDTAVEDMHEASGLLTDLIFGTHPPLTQVEEHALWWLRDNQAENLPMLGSSITFDRAWLTAHTPRLHTKFHYHSLDATSVKLATLATHHHSPHLAHITNWITNRAGHHRDRFMDQLTIPDGQHKPHRVIHDICGSAGLAIAALEKNASTEITNHGSPQ